MKDTVKEISKFECELGDLFEVVETLRGIFNNSCPSIVNEGQRKEREE